MLSYLGKPVRIRSWETLCAAQPFKFEFKLLLRTQPEYHAIPEAVLYLGRQ